MNNTIKYQLHTISLGNGLPYIIILYVINNIELNIDEMI